MKQAILTVGVSASGKTTWSEKYVEERKALGEKWVNVNRDDIRFSFVCPQGTWATYKFSKANEKKVTDEAHNQISRASTENKNIIISDTNLNPNTRAKLTSLLEGLGYAVSLQPFPISFEEACKRDALRANGVGHSVIAKQIEQWNEFAGTKIYKNTYALETCIICDLDGTLAHMNGRGAFEWDKVGSDTLDVPIANILTNYHDNGYPIILMSGREEVCQWETEDWLGRHYVPYTELCMRAKGDFRKDCIVKKELFEKHIRGKYNVELVIDDRPAVVRMWQSMGLKTLIAGNPWIEF